MRVSVIDALKGARSLTADRFGFDDRGRVEVGRKADLVLVEGDVRKVLKVNSVCRSVECGGMAKWHCSLRGIFEYVLKCL
jgi:adenine deaminase